MVWVNQDMLGQHGGVNDARLVRKGEHLQQPAIDPRHVARIERTSQPQYFAKGIQPSGHRQQVASAPHTAVAQLE